MCKIKIRYKDEKIHQLDKPFFTEEIMCTQYDINSNGTGFWLTLDNGNEKFVSLHNIYDVEIEEK